LAANPQVSHQQTRLDFPEARLQPELAHLWGLRFLDIPQFPMSTVIPISIAGTSGPFLIGDFNHDGVLDIITGAITLLGQPDRTFVTVQNSLNLTASSVAAGDFNQDGILDVVINSDDLPVAVYYGNGDGTFYVQSYLAVGPTDFSQALMVGDFNGDGRPDIVACLLSSAQCVLYTNNGPGQFERSYFASGSMSFTAFAADMNNDGQPDIVITNSADPLLPPNFNIILHK
jgi:hypothetical protein